MKPAIIDSDIAHLLLCLDDDRLRDMVVNICYWMYGGNENKSVQVFRDRSNELIFPFIRDRLEANSKAYLKAELGKQAG